MNYYCDDCGTVFEEPHKYNEACDCCYVSGCPECGSLSITEPSQTVKDLITEALKWSGEYPVSVSIGDETFVLTVGEFLGLAGITPKLDDLV